MLTFGQKRSMEIADFAVELGCATADLQNSEKTLKEFLVHTTKSMRLRTENRHFTGRVTYRQIERASQRLVAHVFFGCGAE